MSEMDFEMMLLQYFGDKAWHTASSAYFKQSRNKWFKKLEAKILRDIDSLETSERHKSLLMRVTEQFFKSIKGNEPSWDSIFSALMLISRLLGYDYCKGAKLHTPNYYQDEAQFYTQVIFEGGDPLQDYYDQKDIISQRAEVAKKLKQEGLSVFRISQILNTTEYKIRKLLKSL